MWEWWLGLAGGKEVSALKPPPLNLPKVEPKIIEKKVEVIKTVEMMKTQCDTPSIRVHFISACSDTAARCIPCCSAPCGKC